MAALRSAPYSTTSGKCVEVCTLLHSIRKNALGNDRKKSKYKCPTQAKPGLEWATGEAWRYGAG
jgi:hypothetical protein